MHKGRYEKRFSKLQEEGRAAFIPFTVLGFPDYKKSLQIIKSYLKYADVLELGLPFSDPIADGPTIQAADTKAISSGMNTKRAFKLISEIRKLDDSIPIGLLAYCNMVYRYGIKKFYRDAKKAGVDSILLADLSLEEAKPFLKAAKSVHLQQVFMIAPTTPDARIRKIISKSSGFVYAVALTGVTGARKHMSKEASVLIKRIKKLTNLPVCVGFGISNPKQVKEVLKAGADGVIVGSALVKLIEEKKYLQLKSKLKTLKKSFNL